MALVIESQSQLSNVIDYIQANFPSAKVFTLVGDLGAGKTTFVKSMVKSLGSHDEVSSPTFSLVNEYDGQTHIYHMDLYRIEDEEELIGIGFEEYFDQNAYFFIEWPNIAEHLLPPHVRITIEILPNQERKFNFVSVD